MEKYLIQLKTNLFVYSGYPGNIIKNKNLLKKKKLLHSHPGKVPYYKGSTPIYYSLLKSNKIHCSSIILKENLDNGPVLYIKEYPKPKEIRHINEKYDNFIRSENLIYVLNNFKKLREKKQKKNKIFPYYVIHPILRSLVINYK